MPPTEGPEYRKMETALCYELLSRVTMQEHNVPLASYCAMRALTLGEQLEHLTPVVARAYASLCLTSAADRRQTEATRFRELALHTCKQLGELGLFSYTLTAAAVNEASQAHWSQAVANLKQAIKMSDDLGSKGQWEEAMSQLAHLEFYRGNFEVSRKLYDQCVISADERKDTKMVNRCKAGLAAVLLATGEVESALKILEITNSYGQLALALLRTGKPAEAYEMAQKVKDRFKGRRTKYYVLKGFVSVAEVILSLLEAAVEKQQELKYSSSTGAAAERQLRLSATQSSGRFFSAMDENRRASRRQSGNVIDEPDEPDTKMEDFEDADTLQALAQEWIDKLAQFSSVYALAHPRMLLFKGQMKFLTGEKGTGINLVRKSQAAAQKMNMPYDEALAKHFLATHADTHESPKLLVEAQEFFSRLGINQHSHV